ncbi:alpha/beta fold hydrolase [Halorussus salinisoli]|uniref:alpha/beta fold hydrolase n=1 Tax=Halorussus salinisoli TaxID=2558242 RepID=UPI0010C15F0D
MNYDEWSAAQEAETVSVDGHDLDVAYYDEGSGDPVLFLHGIPTNSFLWRDVSQPITEERRAIVPDMIGYGNSSMYDGFDRSIRAQEVMIDELIHALDLDTVSLVGHDLGGGVLLRYAVHNPDAVDRLVLSNSVAYDSWPIPLITDLGLPDTVEETSVEELQQMLDDTFTETLSRDEPREGFLEGMTTPWRSEEGLVSLVRNAIATNTNHTTEIEPEAVTAETLLLWGVDDEFQSIEYAERLRDDIGDAELTGLDDATHWVMEDRPEAYREELSSFLLDTE